MNRADWDYPFTSLGAIRRQNSSQLRKYFCLEVSGGTRAKRWIRHTPANRRWRNATDYAYLASPCI